MSQAGYTQQRSYAGATAAEAETLFRQDAETARSVGWVATEERWMDGAIHVTYRYVGRAAASQRRPRRSPLPQPGTGWKAVMLVVAALGFVSAVMSGQGVFQFGNMAGVANGLIGAAVWFVIVYVVFLSTSALLGLVSFVRQRTVS